MAREVFVPKRFNEGSKKLIAHAIMIIEDFRGQGYVLTLRQLYYQFVAKGLIENSIQSYKKLGSVISDARLAGLIDWNSIEDRTRVLKSPPSWKDPSAIIQTAAKQYNIDMWENQPFYVEVWVEKDALISVVERACAKYDVPFYACKGYSSQSSTYHAGKRLLEAHLRGKDILVIHLGDHDPSGMDMTRDNFERLSMFAGFSIHVDRIALNMDQVLEYSPPPAPAKVKDLRYEGYVKNYGDECWELDALHPSIINTMITERLDDIVDAEAWKKDDERRTEERKNLEACYKLWPKLDVALTKIRNIPNLEGKLP